MGCSIKVVVIPKDGTPLSDSFIPEIPTDPLEIAKIIKKTKKEINTFLHPKGSITATDPMTGIYGYYVPEIECLVVIDKIDIPIFGVIYERPDDAKYMQDVIDGIVNGTINANAIRGSEASSKSMQEGIHFILSQDKEKAADIEFEIKWNFVIHLNEENDVVDIEVPMTVWAESFRLFLYAKKYSTKLYDESQWITMYKKYIEQHKTECHSGIYTGNYESFTSDLEEYLEDAKKKEIAKAEKAQEDADKKAQEEKKKAQDEIDAKSKVTVTVEDNLSTIRASSEIRSGVKRILGQGTKPSSIKIVLGYNFDFTKKAGSDDNHKILQLNKSNDNCLWAEGFRQYLMTTGILIKDYSENLHVSNFTKYVTDHNGDCCHGFYCGSNTEMKTGITKAVDYKVSQYATSASADLKKKIAAEEAAASAEKQPGAQKKENGGGTT